MGSPRSSNGRPGGRIALLETRVARRLLGLFLLCALLPTALLAVIGYRHVSSQLHKQGRDRLRESSKSTGMAIIERLQLVEARLRAIATITRSGSVSDERTPEGEWLRAVVLVQPGTVQRPLWGIIETPLPLLEATQKTHLASGRALLVVARGSGGTVVLMAVKLRPESQEDGILWAELDLTSFWDRPQEEGSVATQCVFVAGTTSVLSCPGSNPVAISTGVPPGMPSGDLDWSLDGQDFVTGYWSAFLGYQWETGSWLVAISEPRSRLLAPAGEFGRTFVLVILVALVLVFLVSNIQIRRSMEPLARLQEGTVRVAAGNFMSPVTVASDDEFERLADSFNTMAQRLGRQFNALSLINDISRAALSERKSDRVVETVLTRFRERLPSTAASLLLRSPEARGQWHATIDTARDRFTRDLTLGDEEMDLLLGSAGHLWVSPVDRPAAMLSVFSGVAEEAAFLLLPLRDHEELTGVIAIAFLPGTTIVSVDIDHFRQLADQVTVALANTRLMERLEQLSWGTLSALARTIDANSPWTAGHSERVTLLSMAIGRELGLPDRDMDALHRGGLLHDIGKISIPPDVLDKPGKLTDEEMATIRTHPAVGSRILAPIAVFRDIIPIVRHHHEKFDGTGYPDQLAGAAIPFLARVVAVADVYDALVSDRPYRSGWTREAAVELIRQTASSHHDPVVVRAFLSFIAKGGLDQESSLPAMDETLDTEYLPALGAAS